MKEIFLKCIKKFLSHMYTLMVENYAKDLKENVYHGTVIKVL